jgi:hypothetical protein
VYVLGAADETHRSHAESPAAERLAGCGDDLGVVGEAKVVVGAHVDDLPAILESDEGVLRRVDVALAFIESRSIDFGEGGLELGLESVSEHGFGEDVIMGGAVLPLWKWRNEEVRKGRVISMK